MCHLCAASSRTYSLRRLRSYRSLSARYNRRSSPKLRNAGWRRWKRWIARSASAGEKWRLTSRCLCGAIGAKDDGVNFVIIKCLGSLNEGITNSALSGCPCCGGTSSQGGLSELPLCRRPWNIRKAGKAGPEKYQHETARKTSVRYTSDL